MKKLNIIILLLLIASLSYGQQCTSSSFERCLCTTSTPYCTCSALTQTNTLSFSSSYNSHLVSVTSQGCRPCPSNCLKCSSLTVCTQCLGSFELLSGQCSPCPVNCQTCSNGVCSTCISGYYLDYQTNCQTCPIIGTAVCTISSLQSCLSNYWLDNNAANCIACDPNCQQCSSTTKCSSCNQGYYLLSNYTCAQCQTQCLSCTDSSSCVLCANTTLYFNATLGACTAGTTTNCVIHSTSTKCSQCSPGYYLSNASICIQVSQLISQCQVYGSTNGTITCRNCTVGYFNATGGCYYGCSILCNSCYGPHYGLCYACISNAYHLNGHCIPIFNLIQGASYQLFYTAYNNPTFFSGTTTLSSGCLLETLATSTSGQISITLSSLQSYEATIQWKVYLYNLPNNTQSMTYQVTFNNSQSTLSYAYNATYCLSNCTGSSVCINKASVDISSVILSSNRFSFLVENASIGLSQILVIANRCGGVQGSACLECSSTSTCTKCVNPNYYISGYTCVLSCPASYYIRTATKTCLLQCVSGTYANNIELLCLECQSPCLTCSSNTSCLTCVNSTYLYQQNCLSTCPDGYFANTMRRTCDSCVSPCLTCLSNLQCLTCIYGFYDKITSSCVLKCGAGFYGNLATLSCEFCVQPCLTCNSNLGSKCLSCANGTYLYAFSCLPSCPAGYYERNLQCLPCDSSCNTCSMNATNCSSCPIQTYYFQFTCLSSCPSNYFADSTQNTCLSCPQNCSSCINTQFCQTCKSSFLFFPSTYSCLSSCPAFYYPSVEKCFSCQAPCFQCLSSTQCLSCQGLFLFNYTCLSVCPSSTYGDTSLMQCLPCNSSSCKECFGSSTYCTSCSPALILFSGSCLSDCLNGYYLESASSICLTCKDSCRRCLNLTYCLACQDRYIFQNGNCIKVCDAGYYESSFNGSAICVSCPTSCSSCESVNNITICLSCTNNFFISNGLCLNSCGVGSFGYNGICYACIAPCSTCTSENLCLTCISNMGYLFNNSCLNVCPIGFYENTTSYECSKCSQNCLNCYGSANNCRSCRKGLVLQQNTCRNSCISGYYSLSSTNKCYKCSSNCLACSGSPTYCTACSNASTILFEGSCSAHCATGRYRVNNSCMPCPSSCSMCLNVTYCTQCSLHYYLTTNNTCISDCPSTYFPLDGLCKQCSYPCKTCSNYQTCLTCSFGYISQGSCVSVCSPPTFLNAVNQSCDQCPSNCSNCLGPKNCLECLEGVLVNGSCLSQCPSGYYNYYSVCAPCMYGCLSCIDSSTCTFCFIGYLYNGVCLEFCPVGWVNNPNSSQPICEQCISGCLKCTVQANQCTLCGNGLFLYLYTCVTVCPSGTYKDFKTNICDTCKSPCQTCQNGYSCTSCIYGCILYAEKSGNQCIQGPSCPNSFYLNIISNICVYQCPNGTYVDPYRYTCNKPCSPTFVLLRENLTCLEYCPQDMWINSNFMCELGTPPTSLPVFSCQGLILRNILIVECTFNMPIQNLWKLTLNDIQITSGTPIEIIMVSQQKIRIVTNTPIEVYRQAFFTVSFSNRYQLNSIVQVEATTALQDAQRRLTESTYSLPVQNTFDSFYLEQYFSYSDQQRQTGMQLMQIAQSICIGAFIFWFFSLLKNLKSTSLAFLCSMQWIYSISLVDTTFAPNLGLFLEGFKISNLFFSYTANSQQFIWMVKSLYRQTLWGVVNLFDFQTVFLPSLAIFIFFGLVYLVTLVIHKRFSQNPQLSVEKSNKYLQQSEKKEQKVENFEKSKNKSENSKKEVEEQFQREEKSIFSDVVSSKSKHKSSKNILDPNQSNIFAQKKEGLSEKVSISSEERAQSKKLSQQLSQKSQKPLQKNQQKQQTKESWETTKYKLGLKCKIIHERFYYNYWLQCTLLTASPLSIAVCCQMISATPLNLVSAILFTILSAILFIIFIRRSLQEKLFVTTKYWFIIYLETLIQNGMAIISTAEIYIGIMIFILTINIYVWNRIFSSKRSNQLKHFYQINDLLRIILLLEALVGYTNKKNWSSDTYYYYSWIFIVTLIVLIVFGAIHNTKQFFDGEQGQRKSQTKFESCHEKSDTQSSILKSRLTEKQQQENQEEKEEANQLEFFSQHEGEEDTDSDNDIIDFDKASSIGEKNAPKQLIRYEKPKNNQ